nr:puratrophin-1-like [Nerophis lumbriciformis]
MAHADSIFPAFSKTVLRFYWSNPESLDSSIQSALSALYPPFDVTAPIVISQLFRTIEERYHGDALQCLLDFLIPSKHLLESVQQAACAGYSDVVFRCEGWPLCLHDKTVIQLAPVNPLLLRPGDFYLQVEPFGDQAARVVVKSLLEAGCREVEEIPIPETSYPCIFTEDWLKDINDGRQGTPLSRCLLSTDQGVIKLPWAEVAIPEFLDKPKVITTHRQVPPVPKPTSSPCTYGASTLPLEARVLPLKDKVSASLRPVDCSSKLVKLEHYKRLPRSYSKSLVKPVGWVSPNTWDSRNYPEIEGDYVDLVDVPKGNVLKHGGQLNPANSAYIEPARPPQCTTMEPCMPCSQGKLEEDLLEQDNKFRYRESYLAALRNPVPFEKGSIDLLTALEEVGLCEDLDQNNELGRFCNHCNTPMFGHDFCQNRDCCEPRTQTFGSCHKNVPTSTKSEDILKESPVIMKSSPVLSYSHKVPNKLLSQPEQTQRSGLPSDACEKMYVMKSSGKQKSMSRSLSTVSDTPKGSPLFYKQNNRSHSDICPETVSSMMQCKKTQLLGQGTPKLEKMKFLKKDLQPSGGDSPSTSDGLHLRLQISKTEEKSSSQLQSASCMPPPQSLQRLMDKNIADLLKLAIICLPGSRDKTGRAVVEVHCDKEWNSPCLSAQNLCELLLYLHSIPKKDVRELGMTLVVDARKKAPPPHLYKALLMAQEQALHAVHSIVVLVDKDTCPRPEKQTGLQMDLVMSMKVLHKTVDASQLTSELGGTFTYSHTDWLQFHQRLVSFITDLKGADSLLQRAITKVNESNIMDTAQEVHQCIQEQKGLMKEVLEDARLVMLQREGGAVLARMRREEFRFPHSEDYRDSLESVTEMYNKVEEKLHMLVMRSNESLQQLELLFVIRDLDAKIKESAMWFSEEGEHKLKDFDKNDIVCIEDFLQQFDTFLLQAKEKEQYALSLVTEAEKNVGTSTSNPVTDVFQMLLNTFKCNVDNFMSRVEQMHKDVDTLVKVYCFCEQASAVAKECSHFLEKLEQGCYLAESNLSTLQMYEERLCDEFSTRHFQAFKSKACSLRSGSSGAMSVWKLRKIIEELLSTEREYVKALGYVREHYFPELDRSDVPQDLRGQKGIIFGNLEKLHDFHRHYFLNELENCVNEPFRVGRCFLRHRENFTLYALYSKNKPQSDSLLINHGKNFFKQKQQNLRDKMDLWSYLLKPVQRISKYSLLLQDIMRECAPAQTGELAELEAALKVVHFQLRHGNNLLAMDAIRQCDVNLKEQGQLIRQDEFSVTFRKKKCCRHIFLFQELILFSKTQKTDVGNDTYIYKQSFKTSDVGMTQNTGDSGLCFEIWFRKRKFQDTYTLQAVSREVKEAWTKDLERILWDQALHNREVRMQERVFMGIGNKPFMDIQPSDAAINNRAVDCGLMARENKVLPFVGPYGPHNGLPGARSKSAGSRSTSSSSSSSGLGSLSPTAYYCGPKRKVLISGFEGYLSTVGVLEDDMDPESGSHNLLLDSSESSGESVSGLSSSARSYRSVLEREAEDASSVSPSTITIKEAEGPSRTGACGSSEESQESVAHQAKVTYQRS